MSRDRGRSRDRDRDRGRDGERDRDGDGEKKGAPNVEGLFTLKVDNISFRTTAEILREEFKRFGSLGDVYLPRNYSTNVPRGFAFVRFVNREDGEDALRAMDGMMIDGRDIRIQEAKERRAENPKEAMVTSSTFFLIFAFLRCIFSLLLFSVHCFSIITSPSYRVCALMLCLYTHSLLI